MNDSYTQQQGTATRPTQRIVPAIVPVLCAMALLGLSACGSAPPRSQAPEVTSAPLVPSVTQQRHTALSRWDTVSWQELPGWGQDDLNEAWQAALANCERAPAHMQPLCPQMRQLSLGDAIERRQWLEAHFIPYRVSSHSGSDTGLLTGYYEPVLEATREPVGAFVHPLYRMPAVGGGRKFTLSRQEVDSLGEQAAGLAGRQIAYLADPVDVLMVQIQGSTQLRVRESDGTRRLVRLAFAGTNEQLYQSVAKWLLERREIRDASWPSIKAWVASQTQTQRVREMLWSNPRLVFFKEESLSPALRGGPRGAQGVPLTAGRSVAVDKNSIPYGTPIWLVSSGASADLKKLVFAQDTGSAIVGAVRADYFAGSGEEAGQLAGKLKQNLQWWALWPKGATP